MASIGMSTKNSMEHLHATDRPCLLASTRSGVAFKDESHGEITSWSWDFGDETTSNEQHPIHQYSEAGEFVVTLHVEGPKGKARRVKVYEVMVK